ncbi:hypothetical protein [Halospeciosus flavus]|uniref:hypothetical protein n=1 Tax=Halospeciosus flavus TaxID=3032283 RepID=UPI003609026A
MLFGDLGDGLLVELFLPETVVRFVDVVEDLLDDSTDVLDVRTLEGEEDAGPLADGDLDDDDLVKPPGDDVEVAVGGELGCSTQSSRLFRTNRFASSSNCSSVNCSATSSWTKTVS